MLRTGLILLASSTVSAILRYSDVPGFTGSTLKIACEIALFVAIGIFMFTYFFYEYPSFRDTVDRIRIRRD